ncbi:MAG: hypothetical protein JXA77_19045 [Bacteroidales bacterium]|nr:hypothetical protein [Bacteroidales bacterium]MBN2821387.1 hypothetical protein [Bacteroidales bacterium]
MNIERKYKINGILGTIIFHLLLLISFFVFKLGDVKSQHQDLLAIEFSEENYKTIEQIIEESKPEIKAMDKLSDQTISNIVSNTANEMDEKISTEKYIDEVMKELGMEEINPHYDNSIPEDPVVNDDIKKEDKEKDQSANFGQTRVSYKLEDGRKHRHIERPIYMCQNGGTVVVNILVDDSGFVLEANLGQVSSVDACLAEAALNSAGNSYFHAGRPGTKVKGTITYIFVAQ